jgi:hypothetical protein
VVLVVVVVVVLLAAPWRARSGTMVTTSVPSSRNGASYKLPTVNSTRRDILDLARCWSTSETG